MSDKFSIWNGWSGNYSRRDDGYILHAFDERQCRARGQFRSLCGVELEESGLVELVEDGWYPGCIKCCRILVKRGLLIEHQRRRFRSCTNTLLIR